MRSVNSRFTYLLYFTLQTTIAVNDPYDARLLDCVSLESGYLACLTMCLRRVYLTTLLLQSV